MARRRFLIDRIPDEALPRLEPRRPSGTDSAVVMLVSLRDCAPYLGTWPPDCCLCQADRWCWRTGC